MTFYKKNMAATSEWIMCSTTTFITSQRGKRLLLYKGFTYYKKRGHFKCRWCCSTHEPVGCRASVTTVEDSVVAVKGPHNHSVPPTKYIESRKVGKRLLVCDGYTFTPVPSVVIKCGGVVRPMVTSGVVLSFIPSKTLW
ncbi:uncharacterized protein LOC125235138 [Leguminivora glycinivorella]|uniref:uncharacterized protein LOC125235138 n=1 Tax=Leguminivora glycinivorella TaxID=1035111 RepID=UPI00200D7BC7|nr:uncharacterized protein LOC125235138 [Leguminivora glycinivorella]